MSISSWTKCDTAFIIVLSLLWHTHTHVCSKKRFICLLPAIHCMQLTLSAIHAILCNTLACPSHQIHNCYLSFYWKCAVNFEFCLAYRFLMFCFFNRPNSWKGQKSWSWERFSQPSPWYGLEEAAAVTELPCPQSSQQAHCACTGEQKNLLPNED